MVWDAEVMAVLTSLKSAQELRGSGSLFMRLHAAFCSIFFSSRTYSAVV